MMSSVMPSAKKSCSGSPLMLVNGSTAIEGRWGSAKTGFAPQTSPGAAAGVLSCTSPTNRRPLRDSVLISRCSFPLSPSATRAALIRVASADSDTIRPPHTASIKSSLLTTRSRLAIRNCRTSKTCGWSGITRGPRRNSRWSVSKTKSSHISFSFTRSGMPRCKGIRPRVYWLPMRYSHTRISLW